MGTTQRLVPGVSGEPNWGDLSRTVTGVARTVELEKDLEKTEQNAESIKQVNKEVQQEINKKVERRLRQLNKRKTTQVRNAVRQLVLTGGGRRAVSSGSSKSIGRAGTRTSRRIAGLLSDVRSNGLTQFLQNNGFQNLAGKSVQNIVDFLTIFCSESSAGMDETAATKASSHLFKELTSDASTIEEMEALLFAQMDGRGVDGILCLFFGHYIFEHLSQRFEEKLTEKKGREITKETFTMIHKDIVGQVRNANYERPVASINWKGSEGNAFIEKIFYSIISLF